MRAPAITPRPAPDAAKVVLGALAFGLLCLPGALLVGGLPGHVLAVGSGAGVGAGLVNGLIWLALVGYARRHDRGLRRRLAALETAELAALVDLLQHGSLPDSGGRYAALVARGLARRLGEVCTPVETREAFAALASETLVRRLLAEERALEDPGPALGPRSRPGLFAR